MIQDQAHAAEYLGFYIENQQQTQSDVLSSLLEGSVKKLLRSTKEDDRRLALEAIGKLKINIPGKEIEALINDQMPSHMLNLALTALGNNAVVNKDALLRRSEERGVGKECVSTCRYRWWP